MTEEEILAALAAGRLSIGEMNEAGMLQTRLFAPGDEEEVRAILADPNRASQLGVMTDEGLRAFGERQAVTRAGESLERNLGSTGTQALGVAGGVLNAVTLGQGPAILESLTGDPGVGRRAQALQERAGGAMLAGEVGFDVLAAMATGGATTVGGLPSLTPAGIAQVATNRLEAAFLRRAAQQGLRSGVRGVLQDFSARAAANVLSAQADVLARAGAEYAVTGEPVEAEVLLSQMGLGTALGVGLEGLGSAVRAVRSGRGGPLTGLAREQADAVLSVGGASDPDLVRRLRDPDVFRPTPAERDFFGSRQAALASGLHDEGRGLRQIAAARPEQLDATFRSRAVENLSGTTNRIFEGTDEALRSITSPSRRHRAIRNLGAGLDELSDANAANQIRTRLGQALDALDAQRLGFAEGTAGRGAADAVRARLRRIVESADARAFSGQDAVAVQIDQALDWAHEQGYIGRARGAVGSAEAADYVDAVLRQARESVSAADGVDPAALNRVRRTQEVLQSLREGSAFERTHASPSGTGLPRVRTRELQNTFDQDALRGMNDFGRDDARQFLLSRAEAVRLARELDPDHVGRLDEFAGDLDRMQRELTELAEVAEIQANFRLAASQEGKTGGLASALGVPGPGLAAAIGAGLGGMPGAAIGGALGLGLSFATHPSAFIARLVHMRGAFSRTETRAGRAVRRLGASFRAGGEEGGVRAVSVREVVDTIPRLASRLLDPDTREEEYRHLREEINLLRGNPELLLERLGMSLGGLSEVDENLGAQAHMAAVRGLTFLADSFPPDPRESDPYARLRRPGRIPTAYIQTVARRMHIMQDPWASLELAAAGRLTPDHAQTLREVYPQLHAQIAGAVGSMIEAAETLPPYRVRQQLDLLAGTGSDPLMDPAFVYRLQQPRAQTPQQAQAVQGGIRPGASASVFSSLSEGATTQTQRVTVGM